MDKGKYKVKKGGKFFPLYVWTKGDKEKKEEEKNVFYLYFIWFAKEKKRFLLLWPNEVKRV